LAETEYVKAIDSTIEPFKGLLLGFFFFTVGMNIDFRELLREPVLLLLSVAGLITVKSILLIVLARLFGKPWPTAIETGLLLGPGGEFAFVGIGMATTLALIPSSMSSFALAATSLSMALIPLLSVGARMIRERSATDKLADPDLALAPTTVRGHAIVVGHGRVGQTVCATLDRHKFPYLALDSDPSAVAEYRNAGREVYYGDATNPEFLSRCGLMEATAVVVTIHTQAAIDEIVRLVRSVRPDVLIISRARDASHARRLYTIGVTDAVPETIEASLQLSEATLVGLGLPAGPVIASIHQMRDEFRSELQEAAGQAGKRVTHSIRTKRMHG
jgi:CPA2 family monovalent cation:H+ antiporter-2